MDFLYDFACELVEASYQLTVLGGGDDLTPVPGEPGTQLGGLLQHRCPVCHQHHDCWAQLQGINL